MTDEQFMKWYGQDLDTTLQVQLSEYVPSPTEESDEVVLVNIMLQNQSG